MMGARINYEDNLFYIGSWLKQLRTAARLDIDADIFIHKVVEDILFIHEVLRKLKVNLQKNEDYIHRLEHLRLLVLTKRDFVAFLDEIENQNTAFAGQLAPFRDQFSQCRAVHQEAIQAICALLDEETGSDDDESDIISGDEYRFLFNPDEESDIV